MTLSPEICGKAAHSNVYHPYSSDHNKVSNSVSYNSSSTHKRTVKKWYGNACSFHTQITIPFCFRHTNKMVYRRSKLLILQTIFQFHFHSLVCMKRFDNGKCFGYGILWTWPLEALWVPKQVSSMYNNSFFVLFLL